MSRAMCRAFSLPATHAWSSTPCSTAREACALNPCNPSASSRARRSEIRLVPPELRAQHPVRAARTYPAVLLKGQAELQARVARAIPVGLCHPAAAPDSRAAHLGRGDSAVPVAVAQVASAEVEWEAVEWAVAVDGSRRCGVLIPLAVVRPIFAWGCFRDFVSSRS